MSVVRAGRYRVTGPAVWGLGEWGTWAAVQQSQIVEVGTEMVPDENGDVRLRDGDWIRASSLTLVTGDLPAEHWTTVQDGWVEAAHSELGPIVEIHDRPKTMVRVLWTRVLEQVDVVEWLRDRLDEAAEYLRAQEEDKP